MATLADGSKRARRVLSGLAHSSTRPAYVEAIRARLGIGPPPRRRCRVCRSPRVKVREVTPKVKPNKTFPLHICADCGYTGNPTNTHYYTEYDNIGELTLAARAGTVDQPGREFQMARMAVEILDKPVEVLIYGAGRCVDNVHLEKLKRVRKVAVADVMKLRDDAEFLDSTRRAPRRFGVVVASEVIEHFENPHVDFANLFTFVAHDGLLVCSTNVNDGRSKVENLSYPFIGGHTSYYSPGALRSLASQNDMHVDFRVPHVSVGYAGPRKRYVIFSRSRSVMDAVADYFGDHAYAPSEAPDADKTLPERRQRERDRIAAEQAAAAPATVDATTTEQVAGIERTG